MYALAQHIQGHDTQLQVLGRLSNEACDAYRNNPHTNCQETACNLWGAVGAAQTPELLRLQRKRQYISCAANTAASLETGST